MRWLLLQKYSRAWKDVGRAVTASVLQAESLRTLTPKKAAACGCSHVLLTATSTGASSELLQDRDANATPRRLLLLFVVVLLLLP